MSMNPERESGIDAGRMTITKARAKPNEARAWDEFVANHPEARFCHLWGFRQALEKAYGYRCIYLNINMAGERIGIFPAAAVGYGSPRLISQPFNEYGGPLTQSLSVEQYAQLAQSLMQIAHEENCRTIEIRGGVGCER